MSSSISSPETPPPPAGSPSSWETYSLLSHCLRRCSSDVPVTLPPRVFWQGLIAAASHHFVTPTLSWCLRTEPALPDAVRSYLEAISTLNRQRNTTIDETLVTCLQALNEGGISPVLLKGVASRASDLYPDGSLRVIGDIDLLVPLQRVDAANGLLLKAGFLPAGSATRERYPEHFHHLPALRHPGTGITVELHRHLLLKAYSVLLPADSVLRRATDIVVGGHAARLPTPDDRFVHALAHTQLQDANFRRGTPELRQMLELAMLSSRYRGHIDWREVAQCFRAAGYFDVLQDTCEIVGTLFDQPPPAEIPSRRRDPLGRVRRRLQRKIALPTPLLWTVLNTIRTRPAKVFELLNPRKLSAHVSRVSEHVRESRWK